MSYPRSEMRQEWTGRWVHKASWDPRHPQLDQKTPRDRQRVEVCRPDVKQTTGETTLSVALAAGDTTATLTSATGLASKDPVHILLNDGSEFTSFINGTPVGGAIILGSPATGAADAGNAVYLPSINSERWA